MAVLLLDFLNYNSQGRFTGVEGDQRRGRSSGAGERVGGVVSGWRWRRVRVQETGGGGPGAKPLG